jgi:sugar lactone lactonase YvrE
MASVESDVITRALPLGTITVTPTSRNAANTASSQPLVANGLAFNKKGDLFNIDTARGALWKVEFDHDGNLKSPTGCDTTFTADTLCLGNIFVAHPILEAGDGIALDREGNVWVASNERNAVAVVTKDRRVIVFRNLVNLPQPVIWSWIEERGRPVRRQQPHPRISNQPLYHRKGLLRFPIRW